MPAAFRFNEGCFGLFAPIKRIAKEPIGLWGQHRTIAL
jgi:hypothetical protein